MALLGGGGLRAALARAFPARLWAGHRGAAGGACAPSPPDELWGEPDRFGAVWVRLGAQAGLDVDAFGRSLQAAVRRWRAQGRTAVWLHVPIAQSGCIAPAAALGFRFHHAEAAASLLSLWLQDEPSRLPGFATHQVGVAGAVFDESTRKILVVQDRDKVKSMWKFPGGLSEPGENIGDTAVREVFEETGVRAEFRSLLSLRQQHHSPGAFGKSDLFVVCRLEPRSRAIRLCTHECARGAWMDLGRLARTARTTALTSRVARLLLYGHQAGFDKVDLPMEQLPAVHPGLSYQLYHRALPASYRAAPGGPRTPDTARPEGAAPHQGGGAQGRGSDFGGV